MLCSEIPYATAQISLICENRNRNSDPDPNVFYSISYPDQDPFQPQQVSHTTFELYLTYTLKKMKPTNIWKLQTTNKSRGIPIHIYVL